MQENTFAINIKEHDLKVTVKTTAMPKNSYQLKKQLAKIGYILEKGYNCKAYNFDKLLSTNEKENLEHLEDHKVLKPCYQSIVFKNGGIEFTDPINNKSWHIIQNKKSLQEFIKETFNETKLINVLMLLSNIQKTAEHFEKC